jgi:hypothetical protein
MRHAAGRRRWLSTARIRRQPSRRRKRIWPLATRPKRITSAASSMGKLACVLTRRRNSSLQSLNQGVAHAKTHNTMRMCATPGPALS